MSERINKAILLAAGLGSRLRPVTNETPKPLIEINGERIIHKIIRRLWNLGINDIRIVTGYMSSKFNEIYDREITIKLIHNPDYKEVNNISSLYWILKDDPHALEDAYVIESDTLILNDSILTDEVDRSEYLGVYKDEVNDWCFSYDFYNDKILDQVSDGCKHCYLEIGISKWNKEDGKRLGQDILNTYKHILNDDPGNFKSLYWDEVPFRLFKGKYSVRVKEVTEDDVFEIDNLEDLVKCDPSYKKFIS